MTRVKTVLFYGLCCIIGLVLAFFVFRMLLFRFYVPTEELLNQFKGDEFKMKLHRGAIFLGWFQIAIILTPLSIVFHAFIGQKFKHSAIIVTVLSASISFVYLAFGTTFDGNAHLYSFIAMLVFGLVGLVFPNMAIKFLRARKNLVHVADTFN